MARDLPSTTDITCCFSSVGCLVALLNDIHDRFFKHHVQDSRSLTNPRIRSHDHRNENQSHARGHDTRHGVYSLISHVSGCESKRTKICNVLEMELPPARGLRDSQVPAGKSPSDAHQTLSKLLVAIKGAFYDI